MSYDIIVPSEQARRDPKGSPYSPLTPEEYEACFSGVIETNISPFWSNYFPVHLFNEKKEGYLVTLNYEGDKRIIVKCKNISALYHMTTKCQINKWSSITK